MPSDAPKRDPRVGSFYRLDGELWRVCCLDAEGADIHKLGTWMTRHLSPGEWETFKELNEQEHTKCRRIIP
jgi:hypothetical protein